MTTDTIAALKGVTKEQAERDQASGHTPLTTREILDAPNYGNSTWISKIAM